MTKHKGIMMMVPLIAVLACCFLYAPYLFHLAQEGGYPKPDWPVNGSYADVTGVSSSGFVSPSAEPNARLMELIAEGNGKALLVLHEGEIKLEYYAEGYDQTSKLNSYSMIKSLIGILTFKALEEGRIETLDAPLGHFLPALKDNNMQNLSLRALLMMQSGIVFEGRKAKGASKNIDETKVNPFGPMVRLHMNGLSEVVPHLVAGGNDEFNYQNINTALLGAVLEKVYEKPLPQLLAEKIWVPAGAQTAHWRLSGPHVTAYCCLFATPRDWAKVMIYLTQPHNSGAAFLNDNLYNEFWKNTRIDQHALYGFHAYHDILNRPNAPLASPLTYFMGNGGQMAVYAPAHDLIVIRFGKSHQKIHSTMYESWKSIQPF